VTTPDLIFADWPAVARVKACCTLRKPNFNQPVWQEFNLATHTGDNPENVLANRQCLQQHLKTDLCFLQQVHGNRCVTVNGVSNPPESADACVTWKTRLACVVLTADCLPVLFSDLAGQVVAAAHAGWRGLLSGVLENTVTQMQTPAHQLLVWLAPAIGKKNYQVGNDVHDAFLSHDPTAEEAFTNSQPHGQKWTCDLYLLARQKLQKLGVNSIYGGEYCTYDYADIFFSYRRDGPQTGRFASLIWLQD